MLALTYDECRARFRHAARLAGVAVESHPVDARGPHGEELTVDVAVLGDPDAEAELLVLSGVHGVEGFAPSAIQFELLARPVPDGVAVVVVHAVNPWGMAWWRRQNESNVDLNRNWARDVVDPPRNDGYDELHHLLVPGGDELPTAASFLDGVAPLIERHGIEWVRDAISRGQYTHADGLYFGGDRVEASTAVLAGIAERHLVGAERVLTVDLHTGHGPYGTVTLLSQLPSGSGGDRWLRAAFPAERIEATLDEGASTSVPKVGMLAAGLADSLPDADYHTVTVELGTVGGTRMILAERAEHWVHTCGDRDDPVNASAVWEHRTCSTPDDPEWQAGALAHGRRVLDAAVAALA